MWARTFGPGNQVAVGRSVAIDGSGNVTVGGDFQLPIDLGQGSISKGGDFLGRFGPSGAPLWSKGFGAAGTTSSVRFVTADGAGGVIAAGNFTGTVDCGGGPLSNTNAATDAVFITRLDASGHHVWSKKFGDGTNPIQLESVVMDGSGSVLLAGNYTRTISFGGAAITPGGSATTGNFLAALDLSDGAQRWTVGLPSSLSIFAAVDGSQDISLAGAFQGTINLGGGPLTSAGGLDVFVARMDPTGHHLWSKIFGGPDDDAPSSVAVDPAGDILFAGVASSAVDFGGGALAANLPFLVSLGPTGAHRWSKSVTGDSQVDSVAADGSSGFVVAGGAAGTVTVGSTQIPASGHAIDLLVFKLDPSGGYVWGRRSGNNAGAAAYELAVNAGHAAATGMVRSGTIDLGTGALPCAGVCTWVATLAP